MNIPSIIKSEIPQPVEELEIWRRRQQQQQQQQQQQMNNINNNGEGNSPTILSQRGGELTSSLSSPKRQQQNSKGMSYFYITLAKESPQRSYEESDASTYDDFHRMETDICRDSSDTESNSSFSFDGIATMEVLEYDVRSSSSSTENLYSNNSSSGSDDEILLAAVAAKAICEATSATYSSAFADTEESDSENTCDPELSSADYWSCVKCKNRQNNPMFRYCEKCYQIRKNHFPPRPRQWKSRTKQALTKSGSKGRNNSSFALIKKTLSSSATTTATKSNNTSGGSLDDVTNRVVGKFDSSNTSKNNINLVKSKFYNCSRKYNRNNSKSQLNSAAETSSEEDNDWDSSIIYKKKTIASKRRSRSSSSMKGGENKLPWEDICTNTSSSSSKANPNNLNNNLLLNRLENNETKKRKLSNGENEEDLTPEKKLIKISNEERVTTPISDSDETDDTGSSNHIQLQKDSGISSAPVSSQEIQSSCQSDDHHNQTELNANDSHHSSDEDTVCEELDAKDMVKLNKPQNDLNNTEHLLTHTSSDISSMQSSSSRNEAQKSPLRKSLSVCTEQTTNMFPGDDVKTSSQNFTSDNIDNSAGSCIICLSAPKNGVFVHSKFVHLCCCYKCAVKIWNKSKRCPICNCAVKNVMKLFVH